MKKQKKYREIIKRNLLKQKKEEMTSGWIFDGCI